ncbi:MAG TPA: biotin/lipoyl-containing protein [Candidatus Limnocylindria bacterium]|nr:biotin/lipoyl-containing protein [Candidatus Limnocylindria bacterium]
MSRDLDLVDELLELLEGTDATALDVTGDGFSIRIRRRALRRRSAADVSRARPARTGADAVHVKSPAVGIFSAEREWKVGDHVERGALLGGVQSLGHVAEITSPVGGAIRSVLTSTGTPVEFGQALFAIEAV